MRPAIALDPARTVLLRQALACGVSAALAADPYEALYSSYLPISLLSGGRVYTVTSGGVVTVSTVTDTSTANTASSPIQCSEALAIEASATPSPSQDLSARRLFEHLDALNGVAAKGEVAPPAAAPAVAPAAAAPRALALSDLPSVGIDFTIQVGVDNDAAASGDRETVVAALQSRAAAVATTLRDTFLLFKYGALDGPAPAQTAMIRLLRAYVADALDTDAVGLTGGATGSTTASTEAVRAFVAANIAALAAGSAPTVALPANAVLPSSSPKPVAPPQSLSAGAVAGAVIGAIVGVAVMAWIGVSLFRSRRHRRWVDTVAKTQKTQGSAAVRASVMRSPLGSVRGPAASVRGPAAYHQPFVTSPLATADPAEATPVSFIAAEPVEMKANPLHAPPVASPRPGSTTKAGAGASTGTSTHALLRTYSAGFGGPAVPPAASIRALGTPAPATMLSPLAAAVASALGTGAGGSTAASSRRGSTGTVTSTGAGFTPAPAAAATSPAAVAVALRGLGAGVAVASPPARGAPASPESPTGAPAGGAVAFDPAAFAGDGSEAPMTYKVKRSALAAQPSKKKGVGAVQAGATPARVAAAAAAAAAAASPAPAPHVSLAVKATPDSGAGAVPGSVRRLSLLGGVPGATAASPASPLLRMTSMPRGYKAVVGTAGGAAAPAAAAAPAPAAVSVAIKSPTPAGLSARALNLAAVSSPLGSPAPGARATAGGAASPAPGFASPLARLAAAVQAQKAAAAFASALPAASAPPPAPAAAAASPAGLASIKIGDKTLKMKVVMGGGAKQQ